MMREFELLIQGKYHSLWAVLDFTAVGELHAQYFTVLYRDDDPKDSSLVLHRSLAASTDIFYRLERRSQGGI